MPIILIIEDDLTILDVLRDFLQKQGHRCVIATDAYAGITQALNEKPDLVLLDINLPLGGGDMVLASLQSNANTFTLPVICITSLRVWDAVRRLKSLDQVRDIFLKPIDLDKLGAKISEVLNKTRSETK